MFLNNNKIGKMALTSMLAMLATSSFAVAEIGNVFTDEVVVTAQKREQNLQDVGIAITAITGRQMQALGYTNAQEITALAPGVSLIQPNGEANYAIGIRGVANNDFTTNVESPIAIYVDEVYISQMSGAGFMLFDMERAEVLRGPQGTLFGRNATGGLVQYVTAKPSQEFGGYGSLTYGKYNQIKLQGAVNTPLSDTLSLRVSAATNQRDGYIKNRLSPNEDLNNANEFAGRVQLMWEGDDWDALLNVRQGRQDIRTGSFQHVSAPIAGALAPNTVNPYLNGVDGTAGYLDNDGDNFAGDYNFTGHNDLETKGYSFTLNGDLGGMDFTSITDYSTTERDYIEDSDASPDDYFNFFLTTDAEQFSQEFRLAGETDSARWVAGAYYLDLKVNDSNGGIAHGFLCDYLDLLGAGPVDLGATSTCNARPNPGDARPAALQGATRLGIYNPYTTETESLSLFGQWEQDLSNDLTLIVGARVIDEEKTHTYQDLAVDYHYLATSGTDYRTSDGAALVAYEGSRDDTEWAGRLQLDWRPTDDTLYYVSWNRGVKSGGFNAPLLPTAAGAVPLELYTDVGVDAAVAARATQALVDALNAAGAPLNTQAKVDAENDIKTAAEAAAFQNFMNYEPEQLDAFEIGFKKEYYDGTLTVNGAAFYYDYQDYQAFAILGLDTYTRNAEAESYGFELEVQSSPSDGLDFLFGVGYVDTEVTEIPGINATGEQDAYTSLITGGILAGTAGVAVRPVQTPEWNLNALVRYETPIAMLKGNVAFQLAAEYRDEHYFNLTNSVPLTEDGYTLLNGAISYFPAASENVSLRFGVKNLTDEEYIVQGFDLSGTITDASGFWGMTEHYYGQPRTWSVSATYDF